MAMVYRLLFKQLYHTYKRQGSIALASYLIRSFNYNIIDRHFRGSFSQKGEDLAINKYFRYRKKGFYIDIGAYHPQINNNTKLFYDKGWHGINIEPNPSRIESFSKCRKRDINLNIGVGITNQLASFYELEAAGLSTFSKKEADSMIKIGHKIKEKRKIPVYRLEEIIRKYVKGDIDFITIDAESSDLDVLKSNNWKKYRPKLICVETMDLADLLTSAEENSNTKEDINGYLLGKGYREYSSNGLNTLYIDTNQ